MQARGDHSFISLAIGLYKSVTGYLSSGTKRNFMGGKEDEKVLSNLCCTDVNVGSC